MRIEVGASGVAGAPRCYRSMLPFMFALLILQHLAGRLIIHYLPLVRTGAPPASIVNLTFLTLMIVGLGLSLWKRR